MTAIRGEYLALAEVAFTMLADAAISNRWTEPSALATWTVGGLAAHTARAVITVFGYLDVPVDNSQPLVADAAEYYLLVIPAGDADEGVARGVRQRAEASAARGHAVVLEEYREALDQLTARLPHEPTGRLMSVIGGRRIALEDYLVTRMVELTVHLDDLAVSLGLPHAATGAESRAIDALLGTARRRHGDLAVLRALARRERDPVHALRVL